MKRFSTLLTAAAVFLAVQTNAQSINETFNSATAINDLSSTNNCWKFANFTPDNSTAVIAGAYSISAKNLGISTISTPYYDFSGTVAVSFKYRTSSKVNGQAQRIIRVGTTDVFGNFVPVSSETVIITNSDGTSTTPSSIKSFSAPAVPVSGTKRFTIQVEAVQGDGQAFVLIDDVVISGTNVFHYGTNPWNTAPVAYNDNFTTSGSFTNNIFNNSNSNSDNDINTGETFTANIVTPINPLLGSLTLDPTTGNFTFTPTAEFEIAGSVTFTYTITDNGFDPATSNTATVRIAYAPNLGSLPVKLMSFAGSVNNNKAQLKWSVAENETGNQFQVLRSADGKNFSEISTVFISNKAGTESYTFADPKELDAVTYYKLKIENKDGSVSYSNIIVLKSATEKNGTAINILKNPVESTLTFTYSASAASQGQVAIYNTVGVKVYSSRLASQKGTNAVSLNLDSRMAAGTYILEVVNGTERAVTRMIKQ
jgi:hypothetical protein